MAITGSGTSFDPYIPTTWTEFLQCTTTDGIYTKLPDGGGEFNMLDYYPNGEVHNIPLRGFINGNGWKIKNAKVTNTSGSAGYYGFILTGRNGDGGGCLSNMDFINFEVNANGIAATGSGSSATASAALFTCIQQMHNFVEYCRFLGKVKTNDIYTVNSEIACIFDKTNYQQRIYDCAFNIELIGTSLITYGTNWQAYIEYGNIKVKSNDWEFYGGFYNCYIQGECVGVASFSQSNYYVFSTTVFNADIGSQGFRMDYGLPLNVVVNTDKFTGALLTGMIGATTSELKSESDMNAKGFTISNDPTAETLWHISATKNNGFPYVPIMLDIPEYVPDSYYGEDKLPAMYYGNIPIYKAYYGSTQIEN